MSETTARKLGQLITQWYDAAADRFRPVSKAYPLPVASLGSGDLTEDAWGIQKVSLPFSLFHGMWTFDIPATMWFMYENGIQVYTSTRIVSTNGAAVLTADATKTAVILESRECPRYQPNRGHLFSTALFTPSKTADGVREWGVRTTENGVCFRLKADGLLYAVTRSLSSDTEALIDTSGVSGFDVQKGNVYDIQFQWRGVGNYLFFINLTLVHTISNLGTLTALSVANPALPVSFRCTRTTADVSMTIGCADVTSENGAKVQEQRKAAYAAAVSTNGADKPVLVIFNPLTIGGLTNTRTIHIHTIALQNTKKCTFKIWRTRSAADITGETLVAGYGGVGSYVQSDSTDMNAGAVRATAVTVANLEWTNSINVEAGVRVEVSTETDHTELSLVRGDYLVITNDSATGVSDVVVQWGEEI